MKCSARGFTIIELLVVISIIGMLSSVILASVSAARDKARIAAGITFERHTYGVLSDHGVALYNFDFECSGNFNNIPNTLSSGGEDLLHTSPIACNARSSQTPISKGYSIGSSALANSSLYVEPINPSGNYYIPTESYTGFSTGFWFKTSAGNYNSYIDYRVDIDSFGLIGLYPDSIDFIFSNPIDGESVQFNIPNKNFYDNKWHYLFVSAKDDTIVLYIDGKEYSRNIDANAFSQIKNNVGFEINLDSSVSTYIDNLIFYANAI